MIMKFDFKTGTWLFLGCEPGTEEFEIITEVIREAVKKGYEKPVPGRVAARLVEMTQEEKLKDPSNSLLGSAQEDVKL